MFPSRSFRVSGLTFKAFIHFEFIFVYEKVVQLSFTKLSPLSKLLNLNQTALKQIFLL